MSVLFFLRYSWDLDIIYCYLCIYVFSLLAPTILSLVLRICVIISKLEVMLTC